MVLSEVGGVVGRAFLGKLVEMTCFYIVVFLYFFAVFPSKLKKSIWMQNQFSILVYL